ncbi:neuronal acetylcholine receptor subunit beta-3-like [Ptychodera flava]|uniref:neuronal acetylcholine receptor subunit beta-3-like n=1 Tax=Ptychodera flava TaxID=63121 RepID=UPI00396A5AD4
MAHNAGIAVTVIFFFLGRVLAAEMDQALLTYLFDTGYNKAIRPARSRNDTVIFEFGLAVTQLLDVNERNSIITVGVWMDQLWVDYRLLWNASEFDGIDSITVPFDWVWYPDLAIGNSANGEYELPTWKYVTVADTGEIWFTPPAKLESPCLVDVRFFPFDEQRCSMTFGPWEFTADQVLMEPMHVHILKENYIENVEWNFYNSSAEQILDFDECCPDEVYSTVEYILVLRRRPLYYILNILVPCFAMSLLTLAVFYLPSDSGEKVTLSISVLIAISVFSLLVAEIMPPTPDSSPLIGTFLLFNMAVNAWSIIICVIVLQFHHRSTQIYRMSPWVRKFFLRRLPPFIGLGNRFKCLKRRKHAYRSTEQGSPTDLSGGERDHYSLEDFGCNHGTSTPQNDRKVLRRQPSNGNDLNSFQRKVLSFLDTSSRRSDLNDMEEEAVSEWKLLAAVIDRISLLAFVVILFVGSSVILLNTPQINS